MISLVSEMPPELYESLQRYLERHPDWDIQRAMQAALALFLMQDASDRAASRIYLDTVFKGE